MLIPLLALTALAALLGFAMRRVRDRALAALGIMGFSLIAIPALFINGGFLERLAAAIFAYEPYWEYLVPIAAFAIALLPPGKRANRSRRRSGGAERGEEFW
ncbi:MAG: hypothetical protein TU35_008010 [Thermoproteus sp. AZ2]|jgi:peptidoglycan/LPS O-acetylase OafA/YrhL|uniref:Uncharacterized protein n=1 Tax=Thermoproteus sp. AZ2 TaxID=1609232 RepID=A0ACC6V2D5_9CREN